MPLTCKRCDLPLAVGESHPDEKRCIEALRAMVRRLAKGGEKEEKRPREDEEPHAG